jgi:peptidyl-prolyl cis-trans isomerase A (cyclophilin A)
MLRWRFVLCTFLCWISVAVFGGTLAQFRTVFGDIEVELYDQDKPVTVQNFMRYLQYGFYDGMFMHRVVTNFVVQGGRFYVGYKGTPTNYLDYIPVFPPITNEFKVGMFYSNAYGTIAMAKTADPDSARSEFFFNLANNSVSLDNTNNSGGFTVFGHVISGTNILNKLNPGPTNKSLKEVSVTNVVIRGITNQLPELPVLYSSSNTIYLSDLIYIDISLLQVAVKTLVGGAREISWNSATGLTNVVEFTTNMPPSWFTLVRTNGNGNRFAVTDNTAGTKRFYRVRVEY